MEEKSNSLGTCTVALIMAIQESPEYVHYMEVKQMVLKKQELCTRIDEFRKKNFLLQSTLDGEALFTAMEQFEREKTELEKDPLAQDYISAEFALCRLMQEINKCVFESIDIDLKYTEPEE